MSTIKRGFTRDQRSDILRRMALAKQEYRRVSDEENAKSVPDVDRVAAASSAMRAVRPEYIQALPHAVMSACPYCNQLLVRGFDPFDMDGAFWSGLRPKDEPKPCEHYCFFRGAVHFGMGRAPSAPASEASGEALPGPEVPYVIPKQLDLPGMIAVVGELHMEPGWRAFPIAYFASPRPSPELLTSDWCQRGYSYSSPKTGLSQTAYPNDHWDFDLEPWIKQGKLRWCVPGSDNHTLADPSTPCPYLNMSGRRDPLCISHRGPYTISPPDGSDFSPFE